MNVLCKDGFFGLMLLLSSSILTAQNIGIGTSAPLQTLDVNGRLQVANGVIQNGNTAITGTLDFFGHSQTAIAWMGLVTNNVPIKYYIENGKVSAGTITKVPINENGSLGIGSENPAGKLQTKSTVNYLHGQTNTDSLKREMAKQKKAAAAQFAKTQLNAMVTKADDNSFGYYILADGNILIDQKNIPGVPGNKGFVSEAEAKRTADFAIKKLKQGEMPPTLTEDDLKKLKITLPPIKN